MGKVGLLNFLGRSEGIKLNKFTHESLNQYSTFKWQDKVIDNFKIEQFDMFSINVLQLRQNNEDYLYNEIVSNEVTFKMYLPSLDSK